MQTVNFKCGHCGNLMGVSADYLGQQVRCPHCQQVVVAPAAPPVSEPILSQMPSGNGKIFDETLVLPPAPAPDAGSVFSGSGPTDGLFSVPAPTSPEETTVALESRPSPSPESAPAYAPSPDAPATEMLGSPEIPEWMTTHSAPPPTTSGGISELPAPPPVQAPRGGMSFGMVLFLSLVFMPLVLYAVLVTVLALLFYQHGLQAEPPVDPREFLRDSDGDHPGAKKVKTISQLQTDSKYATQPLPANLRLKLGQSLSLGDLLVQAEGVEWAKIEMRAKGSNKPEVRETLKLKLHLTNVSKETAFYPMDCFFDRKSAGQGSSVPLTVLIAGDKLRFFGGPANWNRGPVSRNDNPEPRHYILGNNYDKELKPGEEMDTFVCIDGPDPRYDSDPLQPKFDELKAYKGPLVWHVQVRRGLVRWKDHDYPATAVVGVEFTDQEVQPTN